MVSKRMSATEPANGLASHALLVRELLDPISAKPPQESGGRVSLAKF